MLFAEQRRSAAFEITRWVLRACIVQTTLGDHVQHAVCGMFLTKHRHLAANGIIARLLRAGIMRTALVFDVHHADISMLHTEYWLLDAHEIGGGGVRTRVLCASVAEVDHAVPGMLLAKRERLAPHEIKARHRPARLLGASPDINIQHVAASMFSAESSHTAALGIKLWCSRASAVRATRPRNVHHAVLSVFLAERRSFDAFDVEAR